MIHAVAVEFDWTKNIEPHDLRWENNDTVVGVTWSDGHESRYRTDYLRRICPCAICKDAHASPPIDTSGIGRKPTFNILSPSQVKAAQGSTHVREAYPIGNYALGLKWADGHDEGIYSWRYMRAFCPCEPCAERLKQAAEAVD